MAAAKGKTLMRGAGIRFLLWSMLALVGSTVGAAAQAVDPLPAEPGASSEATAEATIQGFRSARFGMNETQVRAAITSDFKVPAKSIVSSVNAAERTAVLQVVVENLLPVAEKAKVSYIFGYKSHQLIQVNIAWGAGAGTNASPESLAAAVDILQKFFQKNTYKAGSVVINNALPDGTVVAFRGFDLFDHMIVLAVSGDGAKSTSARKNGKATTVLLSYVKDVHHPDIFVVAPGAF